MPSETEILDVDSAVRRRYSSAATTVEPSLCCPTRYDVRLLAAIPEAVLERDYGCGDPSRYLRPGETVLDLGSGTGKICFIASQIVGAAGAVIGVDMNPEMLALARQSAPEVARRIGFGNVTFVRGRIQDLALDLDALDRHLADNPIRNADDVARLDATIAELQSERPLVASESVDVVVSNCVLNLVSAKDKLKLFAQIHRVLRVGGRAVISDIVSDESVPEHLRQNAELWSGCVSGAFREDLFLEAFEQAGFHGVTLASRSEEPWRVVDGIEFRSVTVIAYKMEDGPCLDQKHAIIYRGPFRQVEDDDGHVLRRGARAAVCEKTFRLYSREPYRDHVELVVPGTLIPLDEAPPFPCGKPGRLRDPRETKSGRGPTSDACCPDGNDRIESCC